ncbi:MAG: response regulator [Elusimicrobiota bacterium]
MKTAAKTSILLVDDDDNFRETMSDAMALRDVEIQGATNGAQARTSLQSHTPSLILLDVQLPDTQGFALCRDIKQDERYKNVPVVLLSAKYTEPADRVEGMLCGADAYLSKPIKLDALFDEMEYLLDKAGRAC